MKNLYSTDKLRKGKLPVYQYWLRMTQSIIDRGGILFYIYNFIFRVTSFIYHVEISAKARIGSGLYIGHPYCITINPNTKIGNNCNIHKGVTIGQENRGDRKGAPIIGDRVWIGVNSTIVGAINIGSDVLIAPNTYINKDIPDHSVVYGNPCIIKHKDNATECYINNIILNDV